ncbi:hypothetical protein PQR75_05600 [Paraburkholderia fungorum]|uniref:hypothetical protein n=1 Tax=Paraburkholderia fungorum TaxID=134537 RepID=UPI0038BB2797
MDHRERFPTILLAAFFVIFLQRVIREFYLRNAIELGQLALLILPLIVAASCLARLVYVHAYKAGKERGMQEATDMAEEAAKIEKEMRAASLQARAAYAAEDAVAGSLLEPVGEVETDAVAILPVC